MSSLQGGNEGHAPQALRGEACQRRRPAAKPRQALAAHTQGRRGGCAAGATIRESRAAAREGPHEHAVSVTATDTVPLRSAAEGPEPAPSHAVASRLALRELVHSWRRACRRGGV
jgi:hypothetical protein